MIDMPYFMENKEWYTFDYTKGRFVLTVKAPEEAKQSLIEFYQQLEIENPSQ